LGDVGGLAILFLMAVELTIILEPGEDGFWIATIPEIPGAFSQGKTKAEARENVFSAMEELMEARREMALRGRADAGAYERVALHA
jgi:predicted RNase H-like HicB family nuclease